MTAGNDYYILTSTNVSIAVASWKSIATNQFTTGGAFSFTNTVDPTKSALFYRLKMP